jgi:hypothetical protein
MRIAQILHGKAHYIFEADSIPEWPPDPEGNPIILKEITDQPEVQEGWDYDEATGKFTPPVIPEQEPEQPEPKETQLDRIETTLDILLLKQEGII